MGMIINIDQALKQRTHYNVLREPLNAMLQNQQEAWEKKNPIDLLFARNTMSTFQETYTSSIGFDHAFAETGDYAVGPIFNTAEGFSATYRTRTFQGGFIITQQTLEDGQVSRVKDDANAFMKRWHGDIVEYCMAAVGAGFGKKVTWGSDANGGKSSLKLTSADTIDGDLESAKNPLFTNAHTIVKREGMDATQINAAKQSNCFYVDVDFTSTTEDPVLKIAHAINEVITTMENYRDDNGKRAGVIGAKNIVAANNAHVKAAIETALASDMLGGMLNSAYKRATADYTPYLLDVPCCADGKGIFIIDHAYNKANHGLELTERVPLTLDVENSTFPKGVRYGGRQRFDVNCASWRGIAFLYLGDITAATGASNWCTPANFTKITTIPAIAKPVNVVNTVATKEEATEGAQS